MTSRASPALVLLPGMHGTSALWGPLCAHLPPATQVIAVDYPVDAALDYANLHTFVLAALPSQPYVVLGESFSGPLAVELAAARLPGLRGLVLASSFLRAPVGAALAGLGRFASGALVARGIPAWIVRRYLTGERGSPALLTDLCREMARVAPAVMASRLRAILSVDVRASFRAGALPVLLIASRQDRLVAPSLTEEAHALRPDAEVLWFEHAPHLALQTEAERVAPVLARFLERC